MDGEITDFVPFLLDFVPGGVFDVFQDNNSWSVCDCISDYAPKGSAGFAFLI